MTHNVLVQPWPDLEQEQLQRRPLDMPAGVLPHGRPA